MDRASFFQGKTFVSLDIETTGFEYTKNEIIQIGAVKFTDGVPQELFIRYIKPSAPVPVFIKQLTGITDEQLNTGVKTEQALAELLAFTQNHPLVIHNAPFDIGFLQHHLSLLTLPYLANPLADTLELSRIYLPFLNNHQLGTLISGFAADDEIRRIITSLHKQQKPAGTTAKTPPKEDQAHNALYDAIAAGVVFLQLTDFITDFIPYKLNVTIENIARFSGTSEYMSGYLADLTAYQSKYALSSRQDGTSLTPTAIALGFDKSHNILSSGSDEDAPLFSEEDAEETTIPFTKTSLELHKPAETSATDDTFINSSFKEGGYISKEFTAYCYRKGQVKMAVGVRKALFNNGILLVEAGTGIGKTFAYLVASLEFSAERQKQVFISTNTKNLQEQIFFKDLPLLKKSLPLKFRAVILKGRDNYLCIRKWQELLMNYIKVLSEWELSTLLYLPVWQHFTNTGDISENSSFLKDTESSSKNIFAGLWKKICNDRYFCSGKHCSNHRQCYYQRIRRQSELSNLIIINHHLLLADMCSNRFEGGDNYFIIDEAHNLPELASQFLGISLAYYDFNNFFSHLFNIRKDHRTGLLVSLKADIQKGVLPEPLKQIIHSEIDMLIELIETNRMFFDGFFRYIAEMIDSNDSFGKLRIKEKRHQELITPMTELIGILDEYHKRILALSQKISQIKSEQLANYETHQDKINGALETVKDLMEALKTLLDPNWNNYVFWINSIRTNDTTYPGGVINYSPLDVSELLQKIFYSHIKSMTFTSATLSLRGSFKFFASRMGLETNPSSSGEAAELKPAPAHKHIAPVLQPLNTFITNLTSETKTSEEIKLQPADTLIIPSPFNYDAQSCILIPGFLPPHTDTNFHKMSIELLKRILVRTKGGTMILFTSYRDLNLVHTDLQDFLYSHNITLLAQGKGKNRTSLLNEFKQRGNAVLLGTNSFWEGIDVPGDSLSTLILYKLPFQVPTEPIIEAYYDKLRQEMKDPFMYATLPNAMLRLRQGFGRLIRNDSDRGVVLILDSRIINKKYGIYFRDILPTRIKDLNSPIAIEDVIARWFSIRTGDQDLQE